MQDAGKLLVVFGLLLVLVGGALMLFDRFNLPGSFTFRTGGVTFYVPILASIVLSIILTVVLNLLFRQR